MPVLPVCCLLPVAFLQEGAATEHAIATPAHAEEYDEDYEEYEEGEEEYEEEEGEEGVAHIP